jgi:hypothetical protein
MENYLKQAKKDSVELKSTMERPATCSVDAIKIEAEEVMDFQSAEEASEKDDSEEDEIDDDEDLPVPEPPNPSKPNIRPVRCFLCDCDFESTPEMHFEIHHVPGQMMSCTKCEFQIDSPWYMNLHKQLHSEGEETFIK